MEKVTRRWADEAAVGEAEGALGEADGAEGGGVEVAVADGVAVAVVAVAAAAMGAGAAVSNGYGKAGGAVRALNARRDIMKESLVMR